MISRRTLALAGASLLMTSALPAFAQSGPTANDPLAIVDGIYKRAASGKGDGGGGFVLENKAAKAKYFSKQLVALWIKADDHMKGDIGPIDFDPVTNSQEPDVKSFAVTSEKQDAGAATIAVTLTGSAPRGNLADSVIRYDFVRDGGHWKIDDIRGAEGGKPWSVRELITTSLKN
jgi:hypothetical protein